MGKWLRRIVMNPKVGFSFHVATAFAGVMAWENEDIVDDDAGTTFSYFTNADQHTYVEIVGNAIIDIDYVSISGTEMDTIVDQWYRASSVVTGFEHMCLTREEVLAMATALAQPQDISALAIQMDDGFDPELFALYQHALAHPDAQYRRYAIAGIPYTINWPQFAEPLTRLAESDPDAETKQFAKLTLDTMITHDWNRQKLREQGASFPT